MSIKIYTTPLESLLVIIPNRIFDERGYFEESWNSNDLKMSGLDVSFVQDNHSFSIHRGTLRGLHFQYPPKAQDKLVRCSQGAIFDIAVDIRNSSSTYGRWFGEELSKENGKQLFIPKGFLHGFITLKPNTEVQYKCSEIYSSECDGTVLWNSLDIDWPIKIQENQSYLIKIRKAISFDKFNSPFN